MSLVVEALQATLESYQNSTMMLVPLFLSLFTGVYTQTVPQQAQIIDQRTFNALKTVEPPSVQNLTNVCDEECVDFS